MIAPYVPSGTVFGFDFVTRHTYALGTEYNAKLGDDGDLAARLDLYHSGSQSVGGTLLPKYTIVNGRTDFSNIYGKPIDISLWAINLLDKEYAQQGVITGPNAGIEGSIFGPPRIYGNSVRHRFGS